MSARTGFVLRVAFGLIYMLAGIPGGLLWLVPRPTRLPVAHSEEAPVPIPR